MWINKLILGYMHVNRTAIDLRYLCQLRRVFCYSSEHKCSSLLVKPLWKKKRKDCCWFIISYKLKQISNSKKTSIKNEIALNISIAKQDQVCQHHKLSLFWFCWMYMYTCTHQKNLSSCCILSNQINSNLSPNLKLAVIYSVCARPFNISRLLFLSRLTWRDACKL